MATKPKTSAKSPAKTVKTVTKTVTKTAAKPSAKSPVKSAVKSAVKKVVKKAAPVKKTPAKKTSRSTKPLIEKVDYTLSKTQLNEEIAERLNAKFGTEDEDFLTTKDVKLVLEEFEALILGSIKPKSVEEFTFPGLFKIQLRNIPARKAGVLVRNPATGEMVKGKAKPASVRVKVRGLSKLKKAALGLI